jgi:hypothetical protein
MVLLFLGFRSGVQGFRGKTGAPGSWLRALDRFPRALDAGQREHERWQRTLERWQRVGRIISMRAGTIPTCAGRIPTRSNPHFRTRRTGSSAPRKDSSTR